MGSPGVSVGRRDEQNNRRNIDETGTHSSQRVRTRSGLDLYLGIITAGLGKGREDPVDQVPTERSPKHRRSPDCDLDVLRRLDRKDRPGPTGLVMSPNEGSPLRRRLHPRDPDVLLTSEDRGRPSPTVRGSQGTRNNLRDYY